MATLTLEYWQDDGWFVGRLRESPACFSQGETLEELEANIAEVFHFLALLRFHTEGILDNLAKRNEGWSGVLS
jgi:predicted RNase H-like HicB family nuclease